MITRQPGVLCVGGWGEGGDGVRLDVNGGAGVGSGVRLGVDRW